MRATYYGLLVVAALFMAAALWTSDDPRYLLCGAGMGLVIGGAAMFAASIARKRWHR